MSVCACVYVYSYVCVCVGMYECTCTETRCKLQEPVPFCSPVVICLVAVLETVSFTALRLIGQSGLLLSPGDLPEISSPVLSL